MSYLSFCLLFLFSTFAPAAQSNQISFTTLNCYWFLGSENSDAADRPRSTQEYSLKAGHLIGLLPADPPLFIALQEIGNDKDVAALANAANQRYKRNYLSLFSQGTDSATKQDVGGILDTTRGWGIAGKASRADELRRDLSKHLVVRITNAVATLDICVVHLRVPRDAEGFLKQMNQNRALLRWSMRHLAKHPKANLVILGDFNESKSPGDKEQALAVLFESKPPMVDVFSFLPGKISTHANGRAYDRILISDAIAKGLSGLKFEKVEIGEHRHTKADERRLYTDHYPVTAFFRLPPF